MPRPKTPRVPHMRPPIEDRPGYGTAAAARERLLYGDLTAQQRDDLRARYYFQPAVARRLRAATARALGRRLGGHAEAERRGR